MRTTLPFMSLLALLALGGCSTAALLAPQQLPAAMYDDDERLLVLAVSVESPTMRSHAGSTLRGYRDDGDYVVSDATRSRLLAIARDYHLLKVSEWPIAVLHMQCAIMRIGATESRTELVARLGTDARVQLVQPLQRFATQGAAANDPYEGVQRSLATMGVPAAQLRSVGSGVRIAVIDTGMDDSHPELAGRIAFERNFVDADQRQFRLDRHGTAVAGVIAANRNNGLGMVGIAPQAQLLALKACWQLSADRAEAQCNSYTLAQALAAAIAQRSQIINLSLTGPPDPLLQALTAKALAVGIVLVGPAASALAPDSFPSLVAGVLVAQSARPAPRAGVLAAPAEQILTLAPGGHYDFASGDSVAVAAVSGVAALLLSARSDLNATELATLLTASMRASAPAARTINACQALIELLGPTACHPDSQLLAR